MGKSSSKYKVFVKMDRMSHQQLSSVAMFNNNLEINSSNQPGPQQIPCATDTDCKDQNIQQTSPSTPIHFKESTRDGIGRMQVHNSVKSLSQASSRDDRSGQQIQSLSLSQKCQAVSNTKNQRQEENNSIQTKMSFQDVSSKQQNLPTATSTRSEQFGRDSDASYQTQRCRSAPSQSASVNNGVTKQISQVPATDSRSALRQVSSAPTYTPHSSAPRQVSPALSQSASNGAPRQVSPALTQSASNGAPRQVSPALTQSASNSAPRQVSPALTQSASNSGPRQVSPSLIQAADNSAPRQVSSVLIQAADNDVPRQVTSALTQAADNGAPRQMSSAPAAHVSSSGNGDLRQILPTPVQPVNGVVRQISAASAQDENKPMPISSPQPQAPANSSVEQHHQFVQNPHGSLHESTIIPENSAVIYPAGPQVPTYGYSVPLYRPSSDTAAAEMTVGSSASGEQDDVELRRHQRRLRHAHSEIPPFLQQRRCSQSMTDAKEHAYARLMEELSNAQRELQLKDEECGKLSKVRYQMEEELEDLTASLFEEANKMVQEANIKRMNVEKHLTEANQRIEILQAEVVALKQLVLTSTPSTPNKHLHPQICDASPKKEKSSSSKPFWKSHRRSTSHHEFTKEQKDEVLQEEVSVKEVDTVCFDDFQRWKLQPLLDSTSPFLGRVIVEDIQPCLNFCNKQLASRVQRSVELNSLTIEPIPGDSSYPRKCALSETPKLCNYKIKLEGESEWFSISQMCRNRIAAVCDFFTYIRYIVQGLVKCSDKDMFHEIVKLRMQMAKARLGI